MKFKVGDELHMVEVNNLARGIRSGYGKDYPVKIIKVGRLYITLTRVTEQKSWLNIKFHIDTLKQKTEYSSDYRLFSNEREFSNHKEKKIWVSIFRDNFHYGRTNHSVESLRAAAEILGLKLEDYGSE